MFDAVKNGLPGQMRTAGADDVDFPFRGDRKMKKIEVFQFSTVVLRSHFVHFTGLFSVTAVYLEWPFQGGNANQDTRL